MPNFKLIFSATSINDNDSIMDLLTCLIDEANRSGDNIIKYLVSQLTLSIAYRPLMRPGTPFSVKRIVICEGSSTDNEQATLRSLRILQACSMNHLETWLDGRQVR